MRPGVLNPSESGKYIADNATHVKIIDEGLAKIADEIINSIADGEVKMPETGGDDIHPSKDHVRAADWVFMVDALNFCFWSFKESAKWTVDGHSGYYALEAALSRAIKEGVDIVNPEYYSKITKEEFGHIMRGDTEAKIPLIEERVKILHDVGKKLIAKYDGNFENCIKKCEKSALKLIDLVVEDFPCFDDSTIYKDKKVAIYKRVQILVSDLSYFFGSNRFGGFDDLDSLTMFADYRVPQVLMYFGALVYTDDLMGKLRNDTLLPSGSEEEVEIRGCSIHAVELLKKKIQEKLEKLPNQISSDVLNTRSSVVPNSATIDYFLWCYRRKYARELESIPFHKTIGIYY